MAAEIYVVHDQTLIHQIGESYMVKIGDVIFMATADINQANWFARRFNMARESKEHTAMNILTEQLGYSEETAKEIYFILKSESSNAPTSKVVN